MYTLHLSLLNRNHYNEFAEPVISYLFVMALLEKQALISYTGISGE
jgi:hypothetical protein